MRRGDGESPRIYNRGVCFRLSDFNHTFSPRRFLNFSKWDIEPQTSGESESCSGNRDATCHGERGPQTDAHSATSTTAKLSSPSPCASAPDAKIDLLPTPVVHFARNQMFMFNVENNNEEFQRAGDRYNNNRGKGRCVCFFVSRVQTRRRGTERDGWCRMGNGDEG